MASPAHLQHLDSPTWRDALVRKLAIDHAKGADPIAYLTDIGPEGAALLLPDTNVPLYMLGWPHGPNPGPAVLHAIGLLTENGPPSGHILLIGGGPQAQRFCEDELGSPALRRKAALHHLSEDGTLWNSSTRLRPLDSAVEEIREEHDRGNAPQALSMGEIFAAREAFRQLAAIEQTAATAMRRRRIPGTIGLLGAIIVMFGLETLWGGSTSGVVLERMGGVDQAALLRGEWWRLIAPAFLHDGPLHIAVNGWSLWVIGAMMERLFGTARFLVLYTVGVVGAAAASSIFSQGLSVGASGAIFALMGALVAITWRPQGLLPPTMVRRIRRGLWPTLLINLVISMAPSVDWRAHLGGMLTGVALVGSGLLVRGLPRADNREGTVPRSVGWLVAAGLSVAVLVAGVVAALVHGQPWLRAT